ncbi:MAG: hypothetical protein DRQ39_07955 [Gammaproteobacteria bacterium]|nr:MAG: hypothetical protein DRQ39_07955 [Gammaproteobacteria bacterium]RKZ95120.1 MAG: hypothetical protein DRQ46_08945 [Gammaproteobacteria bacterium]RLA00645.1 MAG: hypothetical protein DRQ42_05035 [Gammaproteobacteria bacterium]
MIEIQRNNFTPVSSSNPANRTVRFEAISDEEKPVFAVERRRRPTRRKPSASKEQIERRVSSDRRRATFNSKA